MQDPKFWNKLVKENAVLNPVDRISEVLFGLIMVLSFTGAISVFRDGKEVVRELLWAALGCNLAWGLVDAIMYLMNVIIERGHYLKILKMLEASDNKDDSVQILKEEVQPIITQLLTKEELIDLSDRIKQLPKASYKNVLSGTDFIAGIQIFFLVFLCTFPVAIPFAFFDELGLALKVSNSVAIALLFIGGYILAGYAGFGKFLTAIIYTLIGVALVCITMALGG